MAWPPPVEVEAWVVVAVRLVAAGVALAAAVGVAVAAAAEAVAAVEVLPVVTVEAVITSGSVFEAAWLPGFDRAATAPNAPIAAMLANAVPTVAARRRPIARLRAPGVREAALFMARSVAERFCRSDYGRRGRPGLLEIGLGFDGHATRRPF